jgi:chromatin modification-related protein VID21
LTPSHKTGDNLNGQEINQQRGHNHPFYPFARRFPSPTSPFHPVEHSFRPQTDDAITDAMTEVGHADVSRLLQSKRNECK